MELYKRSQLLKKEAASLGFDFCGISKADFLEEEAPRLEHWLNQQMHGQMSYMANHFDKRLDPRKLVEGAQSVVSLMYNYYPERELNEKQYYKLSKYAYGKDYHKVIRKKLKQLLRNLNEQIGEIHGRAFVDSAPVLEKAWAQKSGLGWVGKNANLISKGHGSFFFLAELIIDIPLEPDTPTKDYCGTCTKCIEACPTDAITSPYVVDGSKCISYFTIELKEAIPQEVKGKFENWMFGCDICQDVCPWNRFSTPTHEPAFSQKEALNHMTKGDWEEITEELFDALFESSAVKRTKLKGLKRNIGFLKEK